ncbi:hypothetical protein KM043_013010 [Ampulex compressa]|nr:hypothetical protein KM043_013010 [Ampulex compressa]
MSHCRLAATAYRGGSELGILRAPEETVGQRCHGKALSASTRGWNRVVGAARFFTMPAVVYEDDVDGSIVAYAGHQGSPESKSKYLATVISEEESESRMFRTITSLEIFC